ncbi:hypothetical protein [Nocardioides convexus]|nr:hypothetical protein [Nocardioides convexus]
MLTNLQDLLSEPEHLRDEQQGPGSPARSAACPGSQGRSASSRGH